MYSFAQRPDTRVLDEPLFGHFLALTGAMRPSREDVLKSMPTSRHEALASLEPRATDDVLFCKHMANHIEGIPWSMLDGDDVKHILLVRHPDGVLPSYAAHMEAPTMTDVCYEHQRSLSDHLGSRAIVLTAESLHAHPESTLTRLCDALNLPWDARMLRWTPGPRPEDGVWAKHWYAGVHASSGWEPRPLRRGRIHPSLASLREACLAHYLELQSRATLFSDDSHGQTQHP